MCVNQVDGRVRMDTGYAKPPGCEKPGIALTVKDAAQLKPILIGRWLFCDGDPPIDDSNFAGTDLLADGRFVMLLRTIDGDVKQGAGFKVEGTWTAKPSRPNPTGCGVLLEYSAGYSQSWSVALRDKPLQAEVRLHGPSFRLIKAP